MPSYQGQLLISSGDLFDPNFRHTVVLMGDHTPEGALGVVLNRPLETTIADSIPELAPLVGGDGLLYQGGPVQPSSPVLLAEFGDPSVADILVFGSIGFLIGEIAADAGKAIERARVFAGYSGWGPGQLEAEIAEGSWILDPARVEDVFTDNPDLLWSRVLRRMGPEFELLSRMPYDPRMN